MEKEFRVWNVQSKKMLYFSFYDIWKFGKDKKVCWFIGEKVHRMRYIELKDKNDKRIFEGDILCYKWKGKKSYSEVKYESYGFEFNDEGIGFGISHNPKTKIVSVEYSVVGNIYENPELIK